MLTVCKPLRIALFVLASFNLIDDNWNFLLVKEHTVALLKSYYFVESALKLIHDFLASTFLGL